MIKAFFDESYNSNNPRMFVVGGIVAQAREWDAIESGWKTALDFKNGELSNQKRKLLRRYHASEMNALNGDFEGWDSRESREFTERLLTTIRGKNIFILSFAVILDDMAGVFPEWVKDDVHAAAYRYALHNGLLKCGRLAADTRYFEPDQKIEIWHDQSQWNHSATEAFNNIQNDDTFSERERFVKCAHASAIEYLCLQPADMMAYECWRESERFIYSKDAEMRRFFNRIVNIEEHRVSATYADEAHFIEVRERLERKMAQR